jgi:hypothetical protein
LLDAVLDQGQVFRGLDDVQRVRVDFQDRYAVVWFGKESLVSAIQFVDVTAFHLTFVRPVAIGDALHEHICGSLQVKDHIWFGDFLPQRLVDFMIHIEFIAAQVDACKQSIFGKGVICQQALAAGQHFGYGAVLLAVAAEQKEDLGLERIPGPVAVEIREEGILLENFEQQFGIKPCL